LSRIFISGSSTGLGLMVGELLAKQGHRVVLHARNAARAADARRELPKAEAIVVGDLETIDGSKEVAGQVNALGRFEAVIHNAAVGYRESQRVSSDGLPHVFAINTLSAYILTALIARPKRLVYLSSGMHHGANANLDDVLWRKRHWNGSTAYAESKLHVPHGQGPRARLSTQTQHEEVREGAKNEIGFTPTTCVGDHCVCRVARGKYASFCWFAGLQRPSNPGPMVSRRKRAGLCALGPEWCHRARKALSRDRLGGQLCHTCSSLNQLV
jgi:hypothetical protein